MVLAQGTQEALPESEAPTASQVPYETEEHGTLADSDLGYPSMPLPSDGLNSTSEDGSNKEKV